jgi:hypothetical protein
VIAMKDINPLLTVALAASLALAGCVGTQGDASELSASSAGDTELTIAVEAENPGDVSHMGLELDRALAHDANVSLPDGFHEVSLAGDHADVVHDGEADRVEIASGTVPVGTYDQVLLRLANATVETAASEDGHDHGDGENGHDHGDESKAKPVSSGSLDLPLNTTFETTLDEPTEIVFTIDVAESHDGDSLTPVFAGAEVVRGNETVSTESDLETRANPDADVPQDDPAARVAVFAPNGDKVYEPAFDPEDDEFVNSKSSAFTPGETVRFGGTESEPVADGAAIESYEWSFGDGEAATGTTTSHSYDKQGVFEVELSVTDSYGNTASHTVRVIVLQTEWTTKTVEASFEDGAGDWTTSTSGDAPADEARTTWALDSQGHNSSTAWHVGHHLAHPQDRVQTPGAVMTMYPGYTSNADATLTSPTFTVPANWTNAGFSFHVGGASEDGADPLAVTYTVGGSTETVATVDQTDGWTQFQQLEALSDATGSEVQFTFHFTSDDNTEQGPGFFVDDFVIGGVDIPIVNADLLEEKGGGHDGHDHEH